MCGSLEKGEHREREICEKERECELRERALEGDPDWVRDRGQTSPCGYGTKISLWIGDKNLLVGPLGSQFKNVLNEPQNI